ncbi:MAG: hypothetical protein NTW46_01550 [Candidatus Nealsonbacteria bacterium]|nr:hypothetical protein [Candidatus Nealsonbacteria bacterium]
MKNNIIILLIAVIAIGGLAFFGGLKYGQANISKSFQGQNNRQFGAQGQNTTRNGSQQGGFTNGEIISKDDKSITVKMRDGGSKIIFYSPNTEIGKFVSGTAGDINTGENIMVTGTANPDGSITAQSIQIRPTQPSPSSPPQQ